MTPATNRDTALTVEEVVDLSAQSDAATDWRALADRSPRMELFHTWEWATAALDALAEGQPLAVYFVRRNGELLGVFPLSERSAHSWQCQGALRYPGHWSGTLCKDDLAGCLVALGQHLTQHRRHWCLTLPRVHRDFELLQALEKLAVGTSRSMVLTPAAPTRIVRMDGGWEAYLATRSAKVRKEWRRKERKLRDAGNVQLVLQLEEASLELVQFVFVFLAGKGETQVDLVENGLLVGRRGDRLGHRLGGRFGLGRTAL